MTEDSPERWTIRGISSRHRDLARRAAEAENSTLKVWMERAIEAQATDGSASFVESERTETLTETREQISADEIAGKEDGARAGASAETRRHSTGHRGAHVSHEEIDTEAVARREIHHRDRSETHSHAAGGPHVRLSPYHLDLAARTAVRHRTTLEAVIETAIVQHSLGEPAAPIGNPSEAQEVRRAERRMSDGRASRSAGDLLLAGLIGAAVMLGLCLVVWPMLRSAGLVGRGVSQAASGGVYVTTTVTTPAPPPPASPTSFKSIQIKRIEWVDGRTRPGSGSNTVSPPPWPAPPGDCNCVTP